MRRFSDLYAALERTTSTNAKVALMSGYFRDAPPADAAWAVYMLSGQRQKRLIGGAALREWLAGATSQRLPRWLIDDCYAAVGDVAETITLLVDRAADAAPSTLGLADWIEKRLLPLRDMDDAARRETVLGWWRALDARSCYLVTKLITGSLRVGVSKTLVVRALAEAAGLERALIAQRLAGAWRPSADAYRRLLAPADDAAAVASRPYPFFLASPLAQTPSVLGPVERFLAEWKWDGIRVQLVRRAGAALLWSRGEESVAARFPELVAAARALPDGCVIDGEIVAWDLAADQVQPFAALQRRLNRKTVGPTLLREVPVVLLAYDLLEHDGADLRARPLGERRARLETLLAGASAALRVSPLLAADSWNGLAALREQSRARGVEGLMLKARDAGYGIGRQKGAWWKWKVDPYTIDAVLLYAQPGHGRRANLYTDYTFAVWNGDELVPVAKAYSGLSNDQIERLDRWIRRHTVDRFGPVRAVTPAQVFELAFEGIAPSPRHKAGFALRFPRISRWREDLGVRDADTLAAVSALAAAA